MSKQHDALTKAQLPRNNTIGADLCQSSCEVMNWCLITKIGDGKLTIAGPHGEQTCRADQPMEIGVAVAEVLMNQPLNPLSNYRAKESA